ncbi:phosphoethanolamine transferase [uncultured Acidaminococcus sp.]|uniref:phosphoethanolamine transferase n=1 Tax=uncultured Acidaminococcus sp. TaxID=352152 RepID=UPI0029426AEF|nr:phosphoethanolamine transferase [uncultured Acidaminococcus sp.]
MDRKNSFEKYKGYGHKILVSLIVFLGILLISRLPSTVYDSYLRYKDIIGITAVCFLSVVTLMDFRKRAFVCWILMLLLYEVPAYIKLSAGSPLSMDEITDTYCLATSLYSFISGGLVAIHWISNRKIRRIVGAAWNLLALAVIFAPLGLIGYYFLSGHLLTSSIVLTLFQTNLHEAVSYLKNDNPVLWGVSFAVVFSIAGIYIYQLNRTADKVLNKELAPGFTVVLLAAIILCGTKGVAKVRYASVTSLIKQTSQSLEQYKEYTNAKRRREENLKELIHLSVDSQKSGTFVLVIGESESRDHMHAYGYQRETTLWLDQAVSQPENILFTHAYSNHTHTVPTLTYALTEKNQYNAVPLEKAYSIIEVAKAAGYRTYWISNQVKYGAYDTPIAAIASSADQEIWINGNSGYTTWTNYNDGELANKLRQIKFDSQKNNLVIIHLMGSHTDYQERYPKKQEKFSVKDKKTRRINSYDNTVFYTDAVLHQIYDIMRARDEFQGMVYCSDHGEDMQHSHEVTKFTWSMARIPFVVFLSQNYCQRNPATFQNLVKHKEDYWTNDLLYDVLIDLMGIQNLPGREETKDIASDQYFLPLEQGKTCHGTKSLADDPGVGSDNQ